MCVCLYVYIGGSRIQPVTVLVLPSTYPPFIHMAISIRLHTTFDSKGLPLTSYHICPNHILLWLQVVWIQPHADICSREWYSSDA